MTKPRLVVVGPLPPPVHGVTVSTSLVLANSVLHDAFTVTHLDTSDHRSGANIGRWDLTNVRIGVGNLIGLAKALRGNPGTLYLPISQASGAFLRDSIFIQFAAARGWRVAVHLRGSEILPFLRAQRMSYQRWAQSSLAKVTSAAVMGESLRDVFGPLVPASRIVVVPNGTPRNESNGVSRDRRTVLFLSNLRRRKGVVEAMDAARLLSERVPEARFVFAGAWEDAALEQELREMAKPLGERIAFRPALSTTERDLLLASTGVLLFPPRDPEGHPRVVLEAIAAGMPVVATRRGAIAETIEDGVSGFVLAEPRPEALADRLSRLLEDDRLYDSMSRAALARYEERFTQEAADRRLAEWLLDVTTAEPPA